MARGPWILLLVCGWIATAGAQPASQLSPRNANYTIDVRLDPETRRLAGKQILEWTNVQQQPASELWFHLYWNAWRNNRSTWMLEDRIRNRKGPGDDVREDDRGYIEVDSVRRLPPAAASAPEVETDADDAQVNMPPPPVDLDTRFESPDDGNPDDRTVMVATLARPVQPGETIAVELSWSAKIPRTQARTGYRGDFFFFAHWFPKLGVFEPAGWNCHQYHASTEYFSDYGVYDVRMTVPSGWVLGATGLEVDRTENVDGTVTHHYRQADVHAFTWTTSPDYRVANAKFDEPGLPAVKMRLLYQPEHEDQVERHFAATRAALGRYGSWYGPYPYGHVTVVDPAYRSGASGMEYPTLFTCGTRLFNPFGGDRPESVTVHEAGHQFWYGVVGNNEFEHAWIDEGLNTYSQQRVLNEVFGDRIYVRRYLLPPGRTRGGYGFFPVMFPGITVPRFLNRADSLRGYVETDDQQTPSYRYYGNTGRYITYSKTALWLLTLERYLGWETLQPILSTFYRRYGFKHPTPADFFAVAEEVGGRDLSWFFEQVMGSVDFDYAIQNVDSSSTTTVGFVGQEGSLVFAEGDDEDEDATSYRTEVVVQRKGTGQFPVEVLMVFEDGREVRRSWDGRSRWRMFVETRPSKLRYAVVDPDRVLMLDLDYTNNSLLRERAPVLPAVKWGSKWMIWLQDLLSTFAFFI